MKSIIYLFGLIPFFLFFGCGGSSSTSEKFELTTSSSNYKVVEGMKKSVKIISNKENVLFKILDKTDSPSAVLDPNSGVLVFRSPDSAGGNDQSITVIAEENGKQSNSLILTFTTVSKDLQPSIKILKTGANDGGFGESRSFSTNKAGDIVDSFGYAWTQKSDTKIDETKSYIASENKCFVLRMLNTDSNWRLPTGDEVLNLIDYSKVSGQSMIDELFYDHNLTYTWIQSDMQNAKIISFNSALIAKVSLFDKQQEYSSRCINAPVSSTVHIVSTDRFNPVTYDLSTGLQWTPITEQRRVIDDTNQTASEYCIAKGDGYRLPNINELRSVTEDGVVNSFITNGATVLISSTPFNDSNLTARRANYAMYLIEDGSIEYGAQYADELYGITCVKNR